jgi:predicted ester cyclase
MNDIDKQVCLRINQEVFGQGRIELADELLTPDFLEHEGPPGTPRGPEAVKRTVKWLQSGLDDISYDVEDLFGEGDRVALRVTMHATHAREFMGRPATAKRFSAKQIHIFRMAGGRIAEHWAARDDLGMMRQLS